MQSGVNCPTCGATQQAMSTRQMVLIAAVIIGVVAVAMIIHGRMASGQLL
jgi:hypothetical protein